ncbi:Bicoid-interacting protein 3-domain-containing protein [Pilobolus umbonatus]|nr:Bicoid-interacting protein 3-domain-containing protein [Pilobolus umbonatus]
MKRTISELTSDNQYNEHKKRREEGSATASIPKGEGDEEENKRGQSIRQKLAKRAYGNFIGYYIGKHAVDGFKVDPRIDLLDKSLFKNKRVLDIGCNSGNITIAIAKLFQPAYVKGVDLDFGLIRLANSNLKRTYSLQNPHTINQEDSIDLSLRFAYFPQSVCKMHGLLPFSVPPTYPRTQFPHNIEFKYADWLQNTEDEAFDTILALSLVMWIHLNNGDEGLKKMFRKMYDALSPGGVLVLQPPEFSAYKKRAKALNLDVEKRFLFRPEHYTDYLLNEVGFKECIDLSTPAPEGEEEGYSTNLLLFKK